MFGALVDGVPNDWAEAEFSHLRLPISFRVVLPAIKSASAAGLLLGLKWPALGHLTARALVAFFVGALGAHARVRDRPIRYAPALVALGWSALAVRCYPPTSV